MAFTYTVNFKAFYNAAKHTLSTSTARAHKVKPTRSAARRKAIRAVLHSLHASHRAYKWVRVTSVVKA
jgi:hypothetical protein